MHHWSQKNYPLNGWMYILILPFFFAVNHYRGIVIDGPLYLLQVIHSWYPERFIDDVSFMYGNQDAFSLFSPLYGMFIKCFGVNHGSLLLCFFLQCICALSIALLIKNLMERYVKVDVTLPIIVFFMGFYASGMPNTQQNFLFLIESYSVSRLASEALAICGLAFLVNHQKYISLVFFLGGFLMHPLMAGWCLAVWLFVFFPKFKKVIIVVSMLLPLTIFVGKGNLAQYPEGWLQKPLYFSPFFDDIVRFLGYIFFFGFAAQKVVMEKNLQLLCKSLAVIVAIALYWWCWAGFSEHIFLYQVQTFRIEWLCLTCALPIFIVLIFFRYNNFKKIGFFTTYDLALICYGFTVFLPGHIIFFLIAGSIFFVRKESRFSLTMFQWLLILCNLSSLFYQSYLHFYLLGANVPLFRSYLDACKFADSFVFSCIFLCFIAIVYLLKKRKYFLVIPFVAYCIFPLLQLLPLVTCFVWMRKLEEKKYIVMLLLIGSIFEGVMSIDERILFAPLPRVFGTIFVLWGVFAVSFIFWRKKRLRTKNAIVPLIVFSLTATVYAYSHWDERFLPQKISENQINEFIEHPLFPQVKNSGKIFYYVQGFNEAFPRMQFLNGGYYDDNSLTGALFYEGQYKEANRRRNLLYKKNDDKTYTDDAMYRSFVSSVLSKRDSLIDRMDFLCRMKEIENLVTDYADMPFELKDSTYLVEYKKYIFLYSCTP